MHPGLVFGMSETGSVLGVSSSTMNDAHGGFRKRGDGLCFGLICRSLDATPAADMEHLPVIDREAGRTAAARISEFTLLTYSRLMPIGSCRTAN